MGIYRKEGSPFWQYSFKLPGQTQQRGSTGYEDKPRAKALYHKLRSQAQERRDFNKASNITVRELLESTNKNHWHYEPLQWQLGAILDRFGAQRAHNVTTQDLLDFREKRLAQVAPSTVNKELTLLRAAYNYAIAEKKLFENPLEHIKPYDCTDRRRVKFLRPEEKRQLLEAALPNLRDIILFALKTGMRQGEILDLKWESIDALRGQMRVVSYKGNKTIVRYVPIFKQAQEVLDRQPRETEYVFSANGQKLGRYSCVHSTFYRMIKELNIQGGDFHFHDLRHSFASDYLMMGGTLAALQDVLGHRRADTTRIYAHLSKEHLKVEMDRLPYERFDGIAQQEPANFYHSGSTRAVSSDGRVLP